LLKRKGEHSLLRAIYIVLGMHDDLFTTMFLGDRRTNLEKRTGEKLRQNKEIVDLVLHKLFQWFGSSVGLCEINKLVEILNDWPNEPRYKRDTASSFE
jgi:hypothetical protein